MTDVLITCCDSEDPVKAFEDLGVKSKTKFIFDTVKNCTEENALEVFTALRRTIPLLFDKKTAYRVRKTLRPTAETYKCEHLLTVPPRYRKLSIVKYKKSISNNEVTIVVDKLDDVLKREKQDSIAWGAACQLLLELCVGYRYKPGAIQKLKLDDVGGYVSVCYKNKKKQLRRPLLFKSYETLIRLWNSNHDNSSELLKQKKVLSNSLFSPTHSVNTCRDIYFFLAKIQGKHTGSIEVQ